jgi:hydroxypyruvate isomerase
MQSTGLLATSLAAQNQPVARARTGIRTTLMLEMLKGTIEEEFELAARAGFQSVESLTQWAAWSGADIDRVKKVCQANRLTIDTVLAQQDWKKRPVSIVDPAHRPTFLEDVRNAIVYAKKLDIPQISLTSGLSAAGKSQE